MRHRTALITAGSIAAVVFAAAIAIGANLGILTFADSSPVGELTTQTVAQTSPVQPEPSYASKPAAAKERATQKYIIKKAGTVKIAFSDKAVRFVDAASWKHWTWKLAQTSDKKLTVTFAHGSDTYTFVAQIGKAGKLSAKVTHPVTKVLPSSSGGGSSTWVSAPAAASSSASPASSGESESGGGSHNGGGEDD